MFRRLSQAIMSLQTQMKGPGSQYEKWSKKQLIQRLVELEKCAYNGNRVSSSAMSGEPSNSTPADSKMSSHQETEGVKKKRKFDFSKFQTRFVAFRFAYMGWNYNGLNYQYEPTPLPTVEQVILQAMVKAKLVADEDPVTSGFSRCGRTDKGVSALNQVISLNVRSTVPQEEHLDSSSDVKEIPYLTILNALLPSDIRMTAICLRPPPKFDARFSCTYRHYKYLFKKTDLDIERMQQAAKLFEGVHDFRNFCKIDGSKQITNHFREVYSASIEEHNKDIYIFNLKGSAFLWHQVRCMVAILFLVGQKLERPSVVSDLLDISKYPSKPIYEMANDIPLVLYDCVFPEMEWLTSGNDFLGSQRSKLIREHGKFNAVLLDYELKASIAAMVGEVFVGQGIEERSAAHPNAGAMNIGDGRGRNFKSYVPISKRELGEDVESVNARHREKYKEKQKRKQTEGLTK